jgi:hypothetical protein
LTRFRIALALAALACTLAVVAPSNAAAPKLTGTVGPGFTISITKLGKKVTILTPGTYSITVADKSNIHDFHLMGPGVNKIITTTAFVGTKTVVVKLSKGLYRYICDPHKTIMKGSFRVS